MTTITMVRPLQQNLINFTPKWSFFNNKADNQITFVASEVFFKQDPSKLTGFHIAAILLKEICLFCSK